MKTATLPTVQPVEFLTHPATATSPSLASLDEESRRWLRDLRSDGAVKDRAVAQLHALLVRAARFEVARRRATLPHLRGNDLDDIANQAADDALMSVLKRLDDFRGASRFTTWVYKFALLEAAVKLRKRAWQGREVPLEPETWSVFSSAGLTREPIDPRTVLFLRDKGLDISRQVSKAVDQIPHLDHYQIIVALAKEAQQVFPPPPTKAVCLDWSVPDPSALKGLPEEVQAAYEQTYQFFKAHIRDLVEAILGDRNN